MAHKTGKDLAMYLDSSTGVLTDISADVNQQSLAKTIELLEDTGMGIQYQSFLPGLAGAKISLNGFLNTTMDAILGPLMAGNTSITKTAAFKAYTGRYYKGEVWLGDIEISGDKGSLETWSSTLTVDDALTRTSVLGT